MAAHLRNLLNEAVRDGLIEQSPAKHVRLPKVSKAVPVFVTTEQVRVLRDSLPERYRAVVTVAASSGLRQSECFGLTVDRVDFGRRVVRVDRQLSRQHDRPFSTPKTPASIRTVPIPAELVEAIKRQQKLFGPGRHGLVFSQDDGEPIARRTFSTLWSVGQKAAGLQPGDGMHCLRHFYASLLIRAGCSVKVVQARLGHATAAETLDTYAHLWPDDEDRTRDAVQGVLAGGLGSRLSLGEVGR